MTASILGIGTAVPTYAIAQSDAAEMARVIRPQAAEHERLLPALYRRANVKRRGSVLLVNGLPDGRLTQSFFPSAVAEGDRGPGTGARSERYAVEAPVLAMEAARSALAKAAVDAATLTHLVTVSCTGFAAPGIDAELIRGLGLSAGTQRTHVGFMGCHGAINGLRVAKAFAEADAGACVLVCAVELCSLHFQYTGDAEKLVANALFADGAAAAVLRSGAGRGGPPRITACGSCLVPDSLDAMTWQIGDYGFEMTLSARVPGILEGHLRHWVEAWLRGHGLAIEDVGSWAVHPGGPRVLSTVAECLGLEETALEASRAVLAEHGNMSSPTVLFILEKLLGEKRPCVAMAFGPGLCVEACLVE